jgi:hypothetical protein
VETITITGITTGAKLAGVLAPACLGVTGGLGTRLSSDVPSFDAAFARGFGRVDGDARRWADERPTQAPVAAVAVREGYAYAAAGAGNTQQSQQHHQDQTIAAKAATTAAAVATMRAFRGPEPLGKRT